MFRFFFKMEIGTPMKNMQTNNCTRWMFLLLKKKAKMIYLNPKWIVLSSMPLLFFFQLLFYFSRSFHNSNFGIAMIFSQTMRNVSFLFCYCRCQLNKKKISIAFEFEDGKAIENSLRTDVCDSLCSRAFSFISFLFFFLVYLMERA